MSKRADGSYSSAWRGLTIVVVPALLAAFTKHEWHGQDYIRGVPSSSGVILAANHLSYADPLPLCLFTHRAGRYPVFLAKSSLFEIKGLGAVMRGTGQLPVYRGQSDAALVLRDVEQGLRDGACVIFYPEGTATRDPDLWPMVPRTGVARAALATGVPVIPTVGAMSPQGSDDEGTAVARCDDQSIAPLLPERAYTVSFSVATKISPCEATGSP